MEIIEKKDGDVHGLALNGRFDARSAESVEEKVNEILDGGNYKLVVDLSGVDYISSAGLRVLLAVLRRARKEDGGDVRLAGIQPQVQQVFDIAGFTQLFRIFPSEEKAVESYR
jgi:anti-sigma B factor antagonist